MFVNISGSQYTKVDATATIAAKWTVLEETNELHLSSTDAEAAIVPLRTGSRYIRFLPKF